MDDFRILDFDILGNNPNNYIRNEKITLVEGCPWIIPDGAPFFATDLEIYDEKGALIAPRLYALTGELNAFTEMTGKPIWSFIGLDDTITTKNDFVTVSYRSLGAYFVPRNNLTEYLEQITTGKIPVPWSKVFSLPLTFNPSWHIHSILTEIGDWKEVSWFFKALTNSRLNRDKTLNTKIEQLITDAYAELKATKATQFTRLVAHDANYNNPHGINRSYLLLGNRPNARVATQQEEADGLLDNVFSTPQGAKAAIQTAIPDTEGLMENGVLPISFLGGGDFIPPAIDGSFEGLGSDTESTGFCLENNGRLMLLTRHFDGRQKALFFSFIDNYQTNKNRDNIIFTGYKYSNPIIAGDGIEANSIVSGSNHKVLMVGKADTANWYLCMTNGTFNPASHAFVKVNMTPVNSKAFNRNSANFTQIDLQRASIHAMGDYIYLIQSTNINGIGSSATQYFFRCLVADVIAGKPVTWEHVKLTYVDYDGVQWTNVDYYKMLTEVKDANGKFIRAGYGLNPGYDTSAGFYRKFVTYSGEHPTNKNRVSLHLLGRQYFTITTAPAWAIGPTVDIAYEFNPATGLMTLQEKAPWVTYDNNGVIRDANGEIAPDPCPWGTDMTFNTGSASTIILPNGALLSSRGFDTQKAYPRSVTVAISPALTNEWDMCRRSISTLSKLAGMSRYAQLSNNASPLKNSTYSNTLCYSSDGEVFSAMSQKSSVRAMFFKKVTGDYQVRDEITMLNYANVLSRPLSNEVYTTNLPVNGTCMTVSGTAAQLASAGREMGDFGLSVTKIIDNDLPSKDDIFHGPQDGIPFCWPKVYTRKLNADLSAEFGVSRYYGLQQTLLDKLYADNVPAGIPTNNKKAVTLAMFPAENGPMFSGITIGLMTFLYYIGNGQCAVKMVSFRATIEAANASHPNTDLITAISYLDGREAVTSTRILDSLWNPLLYSNTMIPTLQCYRDGNTMQVYWWTGFSYRVLGTTDIAEAKATVNITTGVFTDFVGESGSWDTTNNSQVIPKVGVCDYIPQSQGSSPSATLVQSSTSSIYLLSSTYPSPLWSIFFKEGTRVLINGTKYMLSIGTIDLRDIDPDPKNKKFYVYVGVDEEGAKYVITKSRMRHNNFLIPAAEIYTTEKQILRIDTKQPFLIGDFIMGSNREPGTIPVSTGMPMDEGSFRYIYISDLT